MRSGGEKQTLSYWPQVLAATAAMTGIPIALVWSLHAAGAVVSLAPLVAIGVVSSLAISQAGAAVWKRRPGSGELLFGELLLWSWLRRLRNERRLASALRTLGVAADFGELDPRQRAERLERLSEALEASDPYTHGHSRRVAHYSATIAKQLRLSPEQLARVRTAAAIHDVGKIHTAPEVLRKPDRLSDEEFAEIKRHPVDGARMAEALEDPELTRSVLYHHERLDGSGYPEGLAGEEIPLGARIIAVADTFDAITSTRPYRSARAHRQALEALESEAGTKLDPAAVRAFLHRYSGSRPLAVWAMFASMPQRIISVLGGGVNAAGSAAAGASVAAVTALGVATFEPPRTSEEPVQASLAGAEQSVAVPVAQLQVPHVAPTARPQRGGESGSAKRSRGKSPSATGTPVTVDPDGTDSPEGTGPPGGASGSDGDPSATPTPPTGGGGGGGSGGSGGGGGGGGDPDPEPPDHEDEICGPTHLLPHLPLAPHLPHVTGFEDC